MMELTEQPRREIQQNGWPPEFTDPTTGVTFVLIRKEMFERVRALLEEEDEIAAIEEMYPLVGEVLDAENADSRENT